MTNEIRISNMLKDLGVATNLSGYQYLKYAIDLTMRDMTLTKKITKVIYPMVAKRFGTKPTCVERSIRHAIETGWHKGNIVTQDALFGYTIDSDSSKPTNGSFISAVADYLNMVEQHGA